MAGNKARNVAIAIAVASISVAVWLGYTANNLSKDVKRWKDNYITETHAFGQYVIESKKLTVNYQNQIQVTERELKDALRSNDSIKKIAKHYKELSSVTSVEIKWKHDTIRVPVPIFISHDTIISLNDSCFKASLSVFKGGLSLNNLSIQNKQDIVSGERKDGLFKTKLAFDVINSNPCIQTTGMKSYVVVHKKRFWENPLFTIPLGALGGIIIHNQLTK